MKMFYRITEIKCNRKESKKMSPCSNEFIRNFRVKSFILVLVFTSKAKIEIADLILHFRGAFYFA